jgi:hypothetical protein
MNKIKKSFFIFLANLFFRYIYSWLNAGYTKNEFQITERAVVMGFYFTKLTGVSDSWRCRGCRGLNFRKMIEPLR